MSWFIRRIFKRVRQRHPIEVYVNGRLIQAGSGTITTSLSKPVVITFDKDYK